MVDSPIFVVGPPRSGTTLTAKILGKHPNLFMPGETHFFDDVYLDRERLGETFSSESKSRILDKLKSIYGRYNEPGDQVRVDRLMADCGRVDQMLQSWRSYKEVLSSFMEVQMSDAGKVRWGNNTPRDIFHMRTILSFYPEAKIIVCIRDIRDFLLSYKGKWKQARTGEIERLRKLYHPITTSLLWKSSIRQIHWLRVEVRSENLLILPYERLVQEPELTVREICTMIGEEFEPGMLDVDGHNSSHSVEEKGIFNTSLGRWKQDLAPEEVWLAQAIAGTEMRDFGYTAVETPVSVFKLLLILATYPAGLVRALNANKRKRGPLLPYLMQRIRSIEKTYTGTSNKTVPKAARRM